MLKTLALGTALALTALPALAAGEGGHVTDYAFSFEGPFGSYDTMQLQRGLQVFTEVCSGCHGLSYVAFRTLAPDMELITPIRELSLSRQQELSFLAERGVHLPAKTGAYSINEGMWGTSVGGRETLDSWSTLPEAAFPSGEIPGDLKPRPLQISFDKGVPVALDGQAMNSLAPNDKVWLVPFDLALCVNQYDYFRAVRHGRLEGFWPIAARGRLD